MDFIETTEQKMLRAAVAGIAASYGHDYYVRKARADERSTELWQDLGRNGYLGVNVPSEYGGGGMGISELSIVEEELAAKGCPLLMMLVSPAICSTIIARFGREEQKQRWLPQFATGELKMAFAITEPDAGSNSHRISTMSSRDGDVYRVRGTKTYISGIDEAQAVLVVTRSADVGDKAKAGLSLLVVPTDAVGLERTAIPVQIVAPERQYLLFFDNVEVPAANLIGQEGDGLHQVFFGLNPERILSAALANGLARYALEKATTYARERRVWDAPIGSHQGLAHPLAKAKIEMELARLATQKAAWLYDQGLDAAELCNIAKYAAGEAANACLDQAIQIHGGNGMATEYGLADLWGMTRMLRMAPVSREMVLNFVAQHSLGLARSY